LINCFALAHYFNGLDSLRQRCCWQDQRWRNSYFDQYERLHNRFIKICLKNNFDLKLCCIALYFRRSERDICHETCSYSGNVARLSGNEWCIIFGLCIYLSFKI